jgi:hypothetical protein
MNKLSKILILLMMMIASTLSFGCSSDSARKHDYGEVVSYSQSGKLQFPDFTFEYTGERSEKKEFPNGNSFTFRYYDFKLTGGTETKTISWSSVRV